MDEIPLGDYEYTQILMHRDAHFGGKFPQMITYYEKEGRGVQPDIEIKKIFEIAEWEVKNKQNAAPLLLSASDIDKMADSKKAYQQLSSLYEKDLPKNHPELLIANLILTEKEDPFEEREAIIKQRDLLVPLLIDLLCSQEMHDPLFPGYGLTPLEVAKCLGEIKDTRALFALFEEIGNGDFFDEEIHIKAFTALGEPAKAFLLKIVGKKPITSDNEKGALGLAAFKDDPKVLCDCLDLLEDPEVQNEYPYSGYLALLFDEVNDPTLQKKFKAIAEQKSIPKLLKGEMETMIKLWGRLR